MRPLLDPEFLGLLVEDHGADHIGRQQIGRELDPGERGVDDLGQGPHRERLGQPGHPFEQDVAAGEQPDQQPLDHRLLADDPPGDLADHLAESAASASGHPGLGGRDSERWSCA